MTFKTWINNVRRRAARSIFLSVGKSSQINLSADQRDFKRILISRPNHRLGNQLLLTPLLQEVMKTFPNAEIDLMVKGGAGSLIFKNYPIHKMIQLPRKPFNDFRNYLNGWRYIMNTPYDMAINTVNNSSSGRLSIKLSKAKYKFYGDVDEEIKSRYKDFGHIAKLPVYSFRSSLERLGFPRKDEPIATLNLKLTDEERAKGFEILKQYANPSKPTICLFTYGTGPKCYSREWWDSFHDKLKKEFSDYNIVELLPVENISMISFKEPAFYSKDIREMAAFLTHCKVFVGADSGVMHLASAANIPTVALFSVMNPEMYGPYNEGSISIDTQKVVDSDEHLKILKKILR